MFQCYLLRSIYLCTVDALFKFINGDLIGHLNNIFKSNRLYRKAVYSGCYHTLYCFFLSHLTQYCKLIKLMQLYLPHDITDANHSSWFVK